MPATIALHRVSFATPDGRPLLTDIELSFPPERTGLVGRNGVGKTTLLRLLAGELAPSSGSLALSGRLVMLRQAVRPEPDDTVADLFGIRAELALLERATEGRASVEEIAEVDWTLDARVEAALAALQLAVPPNTPLLQLSGGQVTRAALAALVFQAPDFLLLDEPSNHLDRDGRDAVLDLLGGWKGGAIVISHDRELLERMDAIVELTSLGATRYGGNWSRFRALKAEALAAAQHEVADAEKQLQSVRRSAQTTAERQARREGAGRRKAARGDMPRILIGGRKENSENTRAAQGRLADRQRETAEQALAEARDRLEVMQPFAVALGSSGLPAGRRVLRLDRLSGGHDPARPLFSGLTLEMVGPERAAVTGPNGAGKTTLLQLVTGVLAPLAGQAEVLVPFAVLDQQVSLLRPELSVAENFSRLNPEADATTCRAALARFMFRADAALQPVGTLSGGQMLRAGLAAVLGGPKPPQLLILDEPTNHLDIEAVEVVEAGLRAYDGALLVVSHDERFLSNIGITRRLELGAGTAAGG